MHDTCMPRTIWRCPIQQRCNTPMTATTSAFSEDAVGCRYQRSTQRSGFSGSKMQALPPSLAAALSYANFVYNFVKFALHLDSRPCAAFSAIFLLQLSQWTDTCQGRQNKRICNERLTGKGACRGYASDIGANTSDVQGHTCPRNKEASEKHKGVEENTSSQYPFCFFQLLYEYQSPLPFPCS